MAVDRLSVSIGYVRFFVPHTSGCFWQTAIAMKGYAQVLKIISRPGDDQDRLICPLHEAAGLLGTYKES